MLDDLLVQASNNLHRSNAKTLGHHRYHVMNIDEFVAAFAAEFDDTPKSEFGPDTNYKNLDEWDSLLALSIIAMVDEAMGKRITGNELRTCNTIEELFNLVKPA